MGKMKYYYTKKLYERFKGAGIFTTAEAVAIYGDELDLNRARIQAENSLLRLWGFGAVRLYEGGLSRELPFSTWEIIPSEKWEKIFNHST